MLGHDHPMHPEGVGGPEQGPEVSRVLDLVQGEKEGHLVATGRKREEVIEVRIVGGGDPGHHALMIRGAGDAIENRNGATVQGLAGRGTRLGS